MNSPVASSVIRTRSDWQSCIFCTNKIYKKDGKLHKVEYCGKISRHGRSRTFDTLFSTNDKHCEVWLQTGMVTSIKDCRRYIPVHELCKSLNSVVCNILPAAHAITGCDTTSSFFGIGKKSMLKAMKETPDQFSDLSMISHADIDDSVDVCMIRREIQVPR
jgi:hypothetical protein